MGALQPLGLDVDDMPHVGKLMKKYEDLPMDFADTTFVHVANRDKLREVFALDRCDFGIYRFKRGRSFSIIPTL